MSSLTDKVKGDLNKAVGKIKEGTGKAIGDEKLEAEGQLQNLKGDAQKTVGAVKDAVKTGVANVGDAIKKVAHKI